MIVLCKELTERLDKVWSRLQELEHKRAGQISQIDLDTNCVARLEQTVGYLEAEVTRKADRHSNRPRLPRTPSKTDIKAKAATLGLPSGVTVNIGERMKIVLPYLKSYNGINLPEITPQSEDEWNENYASLKRVYYSRGDFDEQEFFDDDRFKREYEAMVRNNFPGCTVTFNWRSQEIEVTRK